MRSRTTFWMSSVPSPLVSKRPNSATCVDEPAPPDRVVQQVPRQDGIADRVFGPGDDPGAGRVRPEHFDDLDVGLLDEPLDVAELAALVGLAQGLHAGLVALDREVGGEDGEGEPGEGLVGRADVDLDGAVQVLAEDLADGLVVGELIDLLPRLQDAGQFELQVAGLLVGLGQLGGPRGQVLVDAVDLVAELLGLGLVALLPGVGVGLELLERRLELGGVVGGAGGQGLGAGVVLVAGRLQVGPRGLVLLHLPFRLGLHDLAVRISLHGPVDDDFRGGRGQSVVRVGRPDEDVLERDRRELRLVLVGDGGGDLGQPLGEGVVDLLQLLDVRVTGLGLGEERLLVVGLVGAHGDAVDLDLVLRLLDELEVGGHVLRRLLGRGVLARLVGVLHVAEDAEPDGQEHEEDERDEDGQPGFFGFLRHSNVPRRPATCGKCRNPETGCTGEL